MKTEHLPHFGRARLRPGGARIHPRPGAESAGDPRFLEAGCAETDADAVGLGWWVGFRREDGDFLGWWDLSPDVPVSDQPTRAEAGWRLARRHWRQGYATEGAAALLQHGFVSLGLRTIWAETMAVNQPSRGVMAKLGMRHVRTDRSWDHPLPGGGHGEVVYEITREEWLSRGAGTA